MPSIIKNQAGRLEFFAIAQTGDLWHQWVEDAAGTLSAWQSLGQPGKKLRRIRVSHHEDGLIEVFALDVDGNLYHIGQNGQSSVWSTWAGMGGGQFKDLAIGYSAGDRTIVSKSGIEVFAIRSDDTLWRLFETFSGSGWSDWKQLAGTWKRVEVIQRENGRLAAAVLGTDKSVGVFLESKYRLTGAIFPSSTLVNEWGGSSNLGSRYEEIALAKNADGRLEIFALSDSDDIMHSYEQSPGGTWTGWFTLGLKAEDLGVNLQPNGWLQLYARTSDGDIFRCTQDPNSTNGWSAWQKQPLGDTSMDLSSSTVSPISSLGSITSLVPTLSTVGDRDRIGGPSSPTDGNSSKIGSRLAEARIQAAYSCLRATAEYVGGVVALTNGKVPEGLVAIGIAHGEYLQCGIKIKEMQQLQRSLERSGDRFSDFKDARGWVTDVDPAGVDQHGYILT